MTSSRVSAACGLVGIALGIGVATATPAFAGGVGSFLSPSMNNGCANANTAAQSAGNTQRASGAVGGLLAAVPVSTPLNECGGADMYDTFRMTAENGLHYVVHRSIGGSSGDQ